MWRIEDEKKNIWGNWEDITIASAWDDTQFGWHAWAHIRQMKAPYHPLTREWYPVLGITKWQVSVQFCALSQYVLTTYHMDKFWKGLWTTHYHFWVLIFFVWCLRVLLPLCIFPLAKQDIIYPRNALNIINGWVDIMCMAKARYIFQCQ